MYLVLCDNFHLNLKVEVICTCTCIFTCVSVSMWAHTCHISVCGCQRTTFSLVCHLLPWYNASFVYCYVGLSTWNISFSCLLLSPSKSTTYSQLRHLAFCEFWLSNSSPQTFAVSAYSANNLFRMKLKLHKKEKRRCASRRVSHKKSKQGRMM